ncbi:hypothetical protein N3K66_001561 [Trichothecium roseum]|uniref:Uncharacterized protein n=1 Tax=Trichothecium roseum TaxID=47278 RepID=A0ACC0VGL3_9HYPO|nr:hypothetical protein N3K66_001561 [Trichothecium roseum]
MSTPAAQPPVEAPVPSPLPKVTIQYCTQCKWLLRAAYYAQELLSTFSTSLGEVSLQPKTGGVFVVTVHHQRQHTTTTTTAGAEPETVAGAASAVSATLWDRKVDGGFPETKELKRRVRDVIEPGRDLGHVDRDHRAEKGEQQQQQRQQQQKEEKDKSQEDKSQECEDCK